MEDYSDNNSPANPPRTHTATATFLYANQLLPPTSSPSVYANQTSSDHQINNFHLQSSNNCYQPQTPTVKIEMGSTRFQYPSLIRGITNDHHSTINQNSNDAEAIIKAKIIAHPQYSNLLQAYLDCQKVGAPPEVVARLTAVRQEFESRQRNSSGSRDFMKDPELDQFMEAYYDMLVKYRDELNRPLQEAMEYMRRIEIQLSSLAAPSPVRGFNTADEKMEGIGSSEEDQDNNSGGETEIREIDPRAEDRELKNHLLRKYSGYLSSLKQELSKKKKKGKLPKEARQKLLNWWESHYKWPYPSESEKVALAESTGLDQKQINNWFINQRKRHWKPSEDVQFMVMDGLHPHNAAALYMEGHYMGEGPYRLGP
jgi:hypothetical protein